MCACVWGRGVTVISLKPEFFHNAEAILGVYKDADVQASRLLSWDLTTAPDEGVEDAEASLDDSRTQETVR